VITWDKEAIQPGDSVEVSDEVGANLSPVDWADTAPVAAKVVNLVVDDKKEDPIVDNKPSDVPAVNSKPEAQEEN